jgi:hypothetical protein
MKKILSIVKKFPIKGIAFVAFEVLMGIFSIFAASWADDTKSNFFAYTLYATQVIAPIAFFAGIFWYASTKQNS